MPARTLWLHAVPVLLTTPQNDSLGPLFLASQFCVSSGSSSRLLVPWSLLWAFSPTPINSSRSVHSVLGPALCWALSFSVTWCPWEDWLSVSQARFPTGIIGPLRVQTQLYTSFSCAQLRPGPVWWPYTCFRIDEKVNRLIHILSSCFQRKNQRTHQMCPHRWFIPHVC